MLFLKESKFLKILIIILVRLIGAFESPLCSIMYCSIYMGCLLISLFGGTIGLINSHGIIGKVESFVCFSVNVAVNCMFLVSILCRKKVKKLLSTMERDPIRFHNIIAETAKLANVKIIALIMAHNVLALTFVTPSLYLLIFQSTFSDSDKSSEIIPYWFACDQHRSEKLTNMFCWKIETKREFAVKILLQLMLGTMSYFGFCFCFILYCIIIAEFWVHLKIFKSEIADLKNYADTFAHEINQLRSEKLKSCLLIRHNKRMNRKLINIIKYLQYLRHCIGRINYSFRYYNEVLVIATFFCIIDPMLMGFYKSENKMLFKIAAVCGHSLISFVSLCYFAQIISDMNETVLNEMATIPWYNQSTKFRKTYLMVLADTCMPTEVKIFKARVLNLGFLISYFKMAYSILNMLLLKVGKEV